MEPSPHEVLGVAPGASLEEIKRAYRRLAKIHHPDVNPGDDEAAARFRNIQEAFDLLTGLSGTWAYFDPSAEADQTEGDSGQAPEGDPVPDPHRTSTSHSLRDRLVRLKSLRLPKLRRRSMQPGWWQQTFGIGPVAAIFIALWIGSKAITSCENQKLADKAAERAQTKIERNYGLTKDETIKAALKAVREARSSK